MTFLEQRRLIESLATQIVLHMGCATDNTAGVTASLPGTVKREGELIWLISNSLFSV
jgi:hypothetical protein